MPTGPTPVELWNGKEVIGTVLLDVRPMARNVVLLLDYPGTFKAEYGRRYETVTIPIVVHVTTVSAWEYNVKQRLDVRRKSKRQIEAIMKGFSGRSMV